MNNWIKLALFLFALVAQIEVLAQSIKNLELLSQLNPYPDNGYADSWGYVAPDGHEYALITSYAGLSIVDLADPKNPEELYFVEGTHSLWHDVKTYKHYAYVVADVEGEPQGLQIVDLSGLPNSPPSVKSVVSTKIAKIHNISFEEERGLLIMAGSGSDGSPVGIYDVSDPENPVHLADVNSTCHDIMPLGDRLYIATSYGRSFLIYDISNPSSPQFLAEFVAGSNPGYAHNIWPSKTQDIVITSEETVGKTMKIWDISDLNNIHMINEWLADERWIMHQVYIYGDTAWAAHYGAGVWGLDITDPANIVELAHHTPHDFNPDADPYAGSWGGYFNFPSGIIIHSDNPEGLYVLGPKPGYEWDASNPTSLNQFKAYPFLGKIQLNLPNSRGMGIEVYNLKGQPIPFHQIQQQKNDFQVLFVETNAPRGIYNLKLIEK